MKQLVYLSVFCMIVLASCTESFKKGDKGVEYKVISKGDGQKLVYGNFMQLHIIESYKGEKDTVLSDSREIMPRIITFDSVSTPIAYFNILKQLKKGDSAVIRVLTDSVFTRKPEQMPPFMKKGKYMYTSIVLLNIFENVQQADSAQKAEEVAAKPRLLKLQEDMIVKELDKSKAQIEKDNKVINDHLAKNNIKATKGKWGVFVAVQKEGTGNTITRDDIVSVKYSCKNLDGTTVYDSNMNGMPYEVNMADLNAVILGWIDGLLQLKNGSKAMFFIPSPLAYGTNGKGDIIPNTILSFDIEVTNVVNREVAFQRQQEIQKRQMDSLQKAAAAGSQKTK